MDGRKQAMNEHIQRAIELRDNGDFEGSRKLLANLLSNEDIVPPYCMVL